MKLKFDAIENDSIFVTRFVGPVDNDDLRDCYKQLVDVGRLEDSRPHLVDGRRITDFTVTREGMERLVSDFSRHEGALRGYRVAFLADRDLVYGMFRIWQVERSKIGGGAFVFRDEAEAIAWLLGGDTPVD